MSFVQNSVSLSTHRDGTSDVSAGQPSRNGGLWCQASVAWETQLIGLIAEGDREAFATLYDRYAKPLYSLAIRILNDPVEAEDVLQETFIRIWRKAPHFDGAAGTPFSWVATITRNKAIDHLRARQRQCLLYVQAADNTIMTGLSDGIQPVGSTWDDETALIRAAVNELPEHQRRPIELAFFAGLVHNEIAKELKEPLGTIKARIRRGMLHLREIMERQTGNTML